MMRELLLAFVIALVIGSIINGWPKHKPAQPGADMNSSTNSPIDSSTNASANSSVSMDPENTERKDFPDFASFASINNANFEQQVLKSGKPVFVECYVPNSPACDQMLPLVAAVAKSHEDSLVMAKLNVMDNLVIAHRYSIGTVPTFLLFNKGTLVSKLNGILPQQRLEAMIASINQSASNTNQSIQ